MLNYIIWDVDPVLFSLGNIHVRWYGLLWALGIWFTLVITQKYSSMKNYPTNGQIVCFYTRFWEPL